MGSMFVDGYGQDILSFQLMSTHDDNKSTKISNVSIWSNHLMFSLLFLLAFFANFWQFYTQINVYKVL